MQALADTWRLNPRAAVVLDILLTPLQVEFVSAETRQRGTVMAMVTALGIGTCVLGASGRCEVIEGRIGRFLGRDEGWSVTGSVPERVGLKEGRRSVL